MKKEDVEKMLHEKVEKGLHISPVLPPGIKNYLDGHLHASSVGDEVGNYKNPT